MNLPSVLVLLVLAAAIGLSLRRCRRQGKSDCCQNGCMGCGRACGKKRS